MNFSHFKDHCKGYDAKPTGMITHPYLNVHSNKQKNKQIIMKDCLLGSPKEVPVADSKNRSVKCDATTSIEAIISQFNPFNLAPSHTTLYMLL